ncbi:hypothetical protein JX265_012155 [Neoarthrinium moseri]|uniref:Uncharacterized protein n=1 Tax=Neoarthrinium moseri TaxID=1658444 RepID=A0A9P9WAL1_9PEZI|nr:hypothetical protein JX265_012155 [Neoarthrinium moseri]
MAPIPDNEVIPLMSGLRLEMYEALEDNVSYYELSLLLTKHADALIAQNGVISQARSAAEKILQDRERKRALSILLHTIPRTLLKSIIVGTVAHDFLNNQNDPPRPVHYSGEGGGTYVAAMCIAGRNGSFLNAIEIQELVDALRKYCVGYRFQKVHGASPITPQHKAYDQWARGVDSAFGSRPSKAADALWIANDDALKRVELLILSFTQRLHPSRHHGKSKTLYHRQGPLMVGCSKLLKVRMKQHDPFDPSHLSLTTYTWALTLCLIKAELHLTPQVVVKPVTHIWDNQHLGASEVLVTALASSYCFQDGFNVIGAGGQSGSVDVDTLLASKRYVFVTHQFFEDNARATLDELQARHQFVEDVTACAEFPSKQLSNDLRELQVSIQSLSIEVDNVIDLAQKAEDISNALSDDLATLHKQIRTLKKLKRLYRILLRKPGALEEEDDDDDDVGTQSSDEVFLDN